jgi:AcrR family transcriptional regulator
MTDEIRRTGTRRYRKVRRAEQEARTRERIAEAAVKLHGTIGPARTTISAVAREAGVQRATVYRHFPSEEALFEACTAHYWARHPQPDPRVWQAIADPHARLRNGLTDVYRFYGDTEGMLERTSRDAPLVPAMAAPAARFQGHLEALRAALLKGRAERGRRRRRVEAALGHALAFGTWQSLVRGQALETDDAVELMVGMVESAGGRAGALQR